MADFPNWWPGDHELAKARMERQRRYNLAMAAALRTPSWAYGLSPLPGIHVLKTPANHTLRLDASGEVWTLAIEQEGK